MNTSLEQVREQQKHYWDDFILNFIRPVGEEMIKALHLKSTDIVLDVATGTGEPGLSIAQLTTSGKVVGTDISPEMLAVAQAKAQRLNRLNYFTQVCSAESLPFEGDAFDAISCRMGFMYFSDMQRSASEMIRVLKPGSKVVTSVWALPDKNYWIKLVMDIIKDSIDIRLPDEDTPDPFRCATPGLMLTMFQQAGFKNVMEKEQSAQVSWENKNQYWQFVTSVVGPIVYALNKVDEATQLRIKQSVFDQLDYLSFQGRPTFEYTALIISGEK